MIVKLPIEVPLGRYHLTARLGQGGMAELFLGRLVGAAGFEKLVAIKRMLPHLSSDPAFVKMFENEGRIAAQLSHPNVCQVYELGEADGQLFLAMEFLRGLPLHDVIPAIPDRPLATQVRFVVGVIVQACEGLHYAHTSMDVDGKLRPIVHRDVSPSNLMLTNEGTVKLLDFGVSKIVTDVTQTKTGALKGKLAYMAPEQLRGESLDARCDIFAIGVVTWEAIAGRPLFSRDSADDARRMQEQVPRLPGEGPVIAQLDQVIRRALDPDRERRPASARAFAIDLRRAIEACGDPMSPSEIQAHIQLWLGGNVSRHSRDLAAIVGRVRDPAPEASDTHDDEDPATVPLTPEQTLGARLRDASIVVHDNREPNTADLDAALDAAPTLEHVDRQAITAALEETLVTNPQTVPLPSTPLRPPAALPPAQVPASGQVTMQLPPIEPEASALRRAWVPQVVVVVVAIVIGVVAALWLS